MSTTEREWYKTRTEKDHPDPARYSWAERTMWAQGWNDAVAAYTAALDKAFNQEYGA